MTNPQTSKRLSATDWATIVTLYQRGEKNLRELAEQFGVSIQAIHKGLKARGVEKGSRTDEIMDEVDQAARDERERKVKAANQAVESYAKYNDVIVKLTMKRVIEADQAKNLSSVNADLLTLKTAASIVEKARRENWDILNIKDLLGDEAELPDLNVGEYTPEELERIREANEAGYLETLEDEDEEDEGAEIDPDED